jgi:hypothetical protein
LGLKCISNDLEKRGKISKTYQLKKSESFDEGKPYKKCPKKCAPCTNFRALSSGRHITKGPFNQIIQNQEKQAKGAAFVPYQGCLRCSLSVFFKFSVTLSGGPVPPGLIVAGSIGQKPSGKQGGWGKNKMGILTFYPDNC